MVSSAAFLPQTRDPAMKESARKAGNTGRDLARVLRPVVTPIVPAHMLPLNIPSVSGKPHTNT
jgi:hypothetical protein